MPNFYSENQAVLCLTSFLLRKGCLFLVDVNLSTDTVRSVKKSYSCIFKSYVSEQT